MSHPGLMSRREALLAGAGVLWSLAATTRSRAEQGALVTEAVAPGIYIRRGVDEDASAANGDAIANIGFIVGRDAVAVFDPGGSLNDGERLRARIREVTQLPIRFVVLSHVHPDHIFGAGAFEQDRPEFIGHARLPDALAQRGEYYQRGLESVLGKGKAGPLVVPTRLCYQTRGLAKSECAAHSCIRR